MTIIKKLREIAGKRTKLGNWSHEPERYSAKNVIGIKPFDDRWIASCHPEFNGHNNAEFIAYAANYFDRMLDIAESVKEFEDIFNEDEWPDAHLRACWLPVGNALAKLKEQE